jgi:sodium-coupled neutral amino acid transporter 11
MFRRNVPNEEDTSLLRPTTPTSEKGKLGLLLTAVSFANGVIGAGIIGLPGALNAAGFPLGLFLMVFVGSMSALTIRMLGNVSQAYGINSYAELNQRAFGWPGFYLLTIMQLLFAFGAICSYLVIFCDTAVGVLKDTTNLAETFPGAVDRANVLLVASVLLILPLSLFRRYSSLAYLSVIKMGAIGLLVFTVVYEKFAIEVPSVKDDYWKWEALHTNALPAIGTISFAFVAHHQTWLLLGSLKNPTPARFASTVNLAISASCSLSIILASFGYATFFEKTKGDIFVNYEAIADLRGSGLMNAARVLLALNMIFVTPTEMMVARQTIEGLIQRRRRHNRWLALRAPVFDVVLLAQLQEEAKRDEEEGADAWTFRKPVNRPLVEHVLLTVVLYFAAFGVSLATSDLQKVLGLTGSFTAVFLAFVLPAAIRLRLGPGPFDAQPLCHRSNIPVWFVLVFGGLAFVASTGFSLVQLAEG